MATLSTQTIVAAGLDPTYAAAAGGGDKVVPGSTTFLHVINGGGSPVTVTVAAPGNFYAAVANPDLAVTVDASGEKMIPIPATPFGDPADSGLAAVTYSGVTSVTVAALRI
ncbi:hypothetical protein F7R91_14735 [Streptomyces luteolifulvus]|uniref:Uncharacterized protein n=1 Tax=Streptomyces luteolifulvus TaxID=2615112 RepID=A0A6H9V2Z0_9ACTN|nr:hypothetical protein [Streptomyces luteolifulvus]KAB1146830.1 hypothetical protein F7R91_14735 [Streptomyces luteolifulvus]